MRLSRVQLNPVLISVPKKLVSPLLTAVREEQTFESKSLMFIASPNNEIQA